MERIESNPSGRPRLNAKELALITTLLTLMGGCADDVKKCLGERGEGKKESVQKLVDNCDSKVDEYSDTTQAEINEDTAIDSTRFREASEACREASIRAAQLFGDVRSESRLSKGSKKKSCLKAKDWAKARNAEANADAARLHRNQL
jgi:hypothetical protein